MVLAYERRAPLSPEPAEHPEHPAKSGKVSLEDLKQGQ